MKFRHVLLLIAAAALLAAGCGKDSDDKKSDSKKSGKDKDKPALTSDRKKAAKVVKQKEEAVSAAEKAFKAAPKDANVCRNLGLSLISLASPKSTGDPKKAPEVPKDREKNLKEATKTLETCHELAPKDDGITSMLSSTYMATSRYKEASKLLEMLAKKSKGDANAYYAWGLAAQNATEYQPAIEAWQQFVKLAPKNDPRAKQVNQSIVALQQQLKAKKPAAAPAAGAAAGKDN